MIDQFQPLLYEFIIHLLVDYEHWPAKLRHLAVILKLLYAFLNAPNVIIVKYVDKVNFIISIFVTFFEALVLKLP